LPGRVGLIVEYRGTRYCGWQLQPNGVSIQQLLEEAFRRMTGLKTRMQAAARTDSGVHARGQLVAFENPSRHGPERLREGLNFYLPPEVAVLEAFQVAEDFDPRRAAVGKHYRYTLLCRRAQPVFEAGLVYHCPYPLDAPAMQRAAFMAEGEHDFSAFRAADDENHTAVRRLDLCRWRAEPPRLVLEVFGRGFLKQMIRNLVGTMLQIGRRRWPAEKMAELLSSGDRRRAGPTAPASGLCLMRVFTDEESYRENLRLAAESINLPVR
jgi:tRNA pseudouridine38-40 synthase